MKSVLAQGKTMAFDNVQEGKADYSGEKERRRYVRRTGEDRRQLIRFEPDKKDRRSGLDRRGGVNFNWETTI